MMGRFTIMWIAVTSAACSSLFGLDDPLPDNGTCTTNALTCNGAAIARQCGSDCWVGCADAVDRSTAASRCDQWGGEIAPFRDATDEDCFVTEIQTTGSAWTGLTQRSTADSVSESWSWSGDGRFLDFENWLPGQPDDKGGNENGEEQCAAIDIAANGWEDVACDVALPFACRDGGGGDGDGGAGG